MFCCVYCCYFCQATAAAAASQAASFDSFDDWNRRRRGRVLEGAGVIGAEEEVILLIYELHSPPVTIQLTSAAITTPLAIRKRESYGDTNWRSLHQFRPTRLFTESVVVSTIPIVRTATRFSLHELNPRGALVLKEG